MPQWGTKRILVLGMTYPSYSRTYTENVCTGGIDAETCELVRIHPVPRRYLDPQSQFKTFQWIEARVAKHPRDPRPESLRIDPHSIELGDVIPSSNPGERRRWLDDSPHQVASVKELKERQKRDGTSLGILRPKSIEEPCIRRRSQRERREWKEKEKEVLAQENLFGERFKPLDFPELKFIFSWTCDSSHCTKPHSMSLHEWGLHELARKYDNPDEREEKVLQAMRRRLNGNYDHYLFLGSFRTKQFNFGLMGMYSARRISQTSLFGDA